jgi:hypothetical protein
MKNLALLLALFWASMCGLSAQVTVEVVMDRDQFLPNESIPVAVRVVNHSGQTLHLGKDADWLTFNVESSDAKSIVFKNGEVPVVQEFDLETSKMATRRCDLAPYFDLSQAGHFSVTATVKLKGWDMELTSQPKNIDVVQGLKLWEKEFGVPRSAQTNKAPEVRKYILQQATFFKKMQLYVRLTGAAESEVVKLIALGATTSFSRPDARLDELSNLHLMHQTSARTFGYDVISPDGEIVLHQTYDYTSSAPRLTINDDGKIVVVGGVRRVASNDLPATKPASVPEDVKPSHP